MGDRTNPIKFGPEWLRNLSREPSNPATGSGRNSSRSGSPGAASSGNGATPSLRPSNPLPNSNTSKVLLAKLRYGREEMLALYDRQTAEAPALLRATDVLFQPRGKPPYALNTFEDESRDMRGQPTVGGLSSMDRYGMGRGRPIGSLENRGRTLSSTDARGRARGYNRQTSLGRGASWHANARNSYSGMPDDDTSLSTLRPWTNNNSQSSNLRPTMEQAEWANKLAYRNKRQTNTNWRQQQNRDEGEEWRSAEGGRRQPDKWAEREWPERTNQEKPWNNNRRTWVGGDTAEDSLPEWAVENAEACGGTFDSSGAFHGYSNDDSNIPKNTEPYALTRSQTHGSFARSKTAEEGSEEWWASEKAKKLSPKRFDASEIKFKKPPAADGSDVKTTSSGGSVSASGSVANTGAIPKENSKAGGDRPNSKELAKNKKSSIDDNEIDNGPEKQDQSKSERDFREEKDNSPNQAEKPFESENNSKTSDEKGNFQSVILTSNNILRQKHQNIGTPTDSPKKQQNNKMMNYYENNNQTRQLEREEDLQKDKENNRLVEDILIMSLDNLPPSAMSDLLTKRAVSVISPGLSGAVNSMAQVSNHNIQMKMTNPMVGRSQNNQNIPSSTGIQASGQSNKMQPMGITNSMLNASLGLPMPNSSSGVSLQGIQPPSLSNPGMLPSALQSRTGNMPSNIQPNLQNQSSGLSSGLQMPGLQGGMQSGSGLQGNLQSNGLPPVQSMPGFQGNSSMLPNMNNNSLFLGQASANNSLPSSNNIGNHGNQQNMFPMHGLASSASQPFNSSIYGNMMSQPPPPLSNLNQNLSDQWYYEDPNKTIQGPFSSKEMLNWLRAGFFSPSLMVRRACEAIMRPLGAYGIMPFGQDDLLGPFPMGSGFDLRPHQSHDNLMNQQPGLGLDVPSSMGMATMSFIRRSHMAYSSDNANQVKIQVALASAGQFRGILPRSIGEPRPLPPPIPMPMSHHSPEPIPMPEQKNRVESLWGQPSNNADLMWMQGINNTRNENRINNLPMYFWEQQPSPAIPSTALLPEDIAKEMKTEEDIIAQMRASQAPVPPPPALSFLGDQPLPPVPEDLTASADLNMKELQKLIQSEIGTIPSDDPKCDKSSKSEKNGVETAKSNKSTDTKQKTLKVEEKKGKDNVTKLKAKKIKDEKKEDAADIKVKDDDDKIEKRSAEPSPSPKTKKDDKSKKESEKEKKEWIKEGFTIVKGTDKNKDSKKKAEEAKAAEEFERKRKEEEKIAEDELRKRQMETLRKQQEIQNQQQQQARQAELISRKAPWSASNQGISTPFPGPTLAEIQRLEREKKLEQMKEQQQMMQIIAQQQQAALAREQVFGGQEMQAGLGWAKTPNNSTPSQTLAEIQAEARKQAAAAVAATAVREETQPTPSPPINIVPWGNTVYNGPTSAMNLSGFWDTPVDTPKPTKPVEPPKQEPKPKKKVTVVIPAKKENSPSVDFDNWCTSALTSLRDSNIDVPTFITFLRDIESPYEVKDYVKCYLGDTKESGDFARQFLERRSRLLRVGMVTPSDDLCSPAIAINPRTNSGSDYTDVKSKGKKAKKNKMLKVDARNILGFSVTASEDRINVGDIDTV